MVVSLTLVPYSVLKNQKTRRHLTEFWMMDAEYSYLTHDESLDLQEAYVKALLQGVLDRAPQALETLERDTELLKRYISEPFNVSLTIKPLTSCKSMRMMKMLTTNILSMVMTLVHHMKLGFQTTLVCQLLL